MQGGDWYWEHRWGLGDWERAQKGNASLWRPLRATTLLQGLPIAHSSEAPLPSLPCCSALPPLAPHLTWIFSSRGFDSPLLARLSLSRRCLWFSPDPEFSESELSYLLIGCKRCDCWSGRSSTNFRFKGKIWNGGPHTAFSGTPEFNSHSQGSLRGEGKTSCGA